MQDLQNDMENLGSRHLTRLAEEIVNQIRKIIHSQWSPKNQKHLEELQKIGVGILKTIEDKGDLKEILPAATQALQNLSGALGAKVNDLQAPEQEQGEDITQDDFELTGDGPNQVQEDPNQGDPNQDPMAAGAPQAGMQPPPPAPGGQPMPQPPAI
jgi:hypothetical protein